MSYACLPLIRVPTQVLKFDNLEENVFFSVISVENLCCCHLYSCIFGQCKTHLHSKLLYLTKQAFQSKKKWNLEVENV